MMVTMDLFEFEYIFHIGCGRCRCRGFRGWMYSNSIGIVLLLGCVVVCGVGTGSTHTSFSRVVIGVVGGVGAGSAHTSSSLGVVVTRVVVVAEWVTEWVTETEWVDEVEWVDE